MKLADLTYLLLDSTYVIIEDTDGTELERYDGWDSLSGDYDDYEVLNICVDIRGTDPYLTVTIETEVN